jgi:UDP-glucose 4-epimerase
MMLRHKNNQPVSPTRVVVLGSNGFVAAAVVRRLFARGISVLSLPRTSINLVKPEAATKLANILRRDDTLLFAAAKAPVKNEEMLIENLQMGATVSEAIRKTPVKHVIYISSDAVYADSDAPLTEQSCAQPASLHGVMHLTREVMLANAYTGPLCLLRPTLIFGEDDPHNGYGPNRFMRLAAAQREIILFGQGEERRDHIWVEDVAEIILLALIHQSYGVLNLATGIVTSFAELAQIATTLFPGGVIKTSPRNGIVPHKGFRPFNTSALRQAFPEHQCTPVREGMTKLRDAYNAGIKG